MSILKNNLHFVFAAMLICFSTISFAQMNMSAGYLASRIDGDTVSFNLQSNQTKDYYDLMGGTADKGLIRIVFNGITNAADIKVQSVSLEQFGDKGESINVLWADFYTQVPYVIKSGKLTITSNSGGVLKGSLELKVQLGESSVIGDFLKGKKESELKQGYFEAKY